MHAEVFLGLWCPQFAWLHNGFLRDTFADSHNGSFDFFFPLSLHEEVLKLTKKEKNVCQAFFLPPPPLSLWSQRLSFFLCVSLQLQKRKEREEQLEDVIQAYEKIHMEKSNLQRDLDKMVRDIIQFTASCVRYFTVASHTSHMAH